MDRNVDNFLQRQKWKNSAEYKEQVRKGSMNYKLISLRMDSYIYDLI